MAGAGDVVVEMDLWNRGVSTILREVELLPLEQKKVVSSGTNALLQIKGAMHEIVETCHGASICAACGGKCCVCGKYHFSAIDLIAYHETGETLFTPDFKSHLCPFLKSSRCLMPPEYRPFNCVTFVCEPIEDSFSSAEHERFYCLERELRLTYGMLQKLFSGGRMHRSVLSFCD